MHGSPGRHGGRNILPLASTIVVVSTRPAAPTAALDRACRLGEFPRAAVDGAGVGTVCAATVHDVETAPCGLVEYSHDVHTDAGELCVGRELGYEGRDEVELVGYVCGYWDAAGRAVGYVREL